MSFVAPFFGIQPIRMYAQTSAYERIVLDPAWANEAKHDDWRCHVQWTGRSLVSWSNTGNLLPLPANAAKALAAVDLPPGTVIDGCLLGKRGGPPGYLAFDIAMWAGRELDENLDARRARLESLKIDLVERLPNSVEAFRLALAMSNKETGRHVEGIVMKRREARYRRMSRPKQTFADWIKVKVESRYDSATRQIKVKG